MQQQSGFEEEETPPYQSQGYDMGLEEVRIEGFTPAGMKYLDRWMLTFVCVVLTIRLVLIALLVHHIPRDELIASILMPGFMSLLFVVLTKFLPKKYRPVLILKPEGLTIQRPFETIEIPWSEVGEIRTARSLGPPMVVLTVPNKPFKRRLGGAYRFPGSVIGLNAATFGYSGPGLIEKISRYRDSVT